MTLFTNLQSLVIRSHPNITKASIPFFNDMKRIEILNVTKTKIILTDLCENLNNPTLKEVELNAEDNEENIEKKLLILKERMPHCEITLN